MNIVEKRKKKCFLRIKVYKYKKLREKEKIIFIIFYLNQFIYVNFIIKIILKI